MFNKEAWVSHRTKLSKSRLLTPCAVQLRWLQKKKKKIWHQEKLSEQPNVNLEIKAVVKRIGFSWHSPVLHGVASLQPRFWAHSMYPVHSMHCHMPWHVNEHCLKYLGYNYRPLHMIVDVISLGTQTSLLPNRSMMGNKALILSH